MASTRLPKSGLGEDGIKVQLLFVKKIKTP